MSLEIGGSAGLNVSYYYLAGGNVSCEGGSLFSFRFNYPVELLWHVRSFVSSSFELLWETGEQEIKWYRVVGKCKPGDECDLKSEEEDCSRQLVVNIPARNLKELCEKLSKRSFSWPVDSIYVYNRPAENSVVKQREAEGENFNCVAMEKMNKYTMCQIPECMDICVDYISRDNFYFDLLNVLFVKDYEYSGDGIVYISGQADTSYEKYLPVFPYEGGDGELLIDSVSDSSFTYSYSFSNTEGKIVINDGSTYSMIGVGAYRYVGGSSSLIIGGSSSASFTPNWSFDGGNWPSETDWVAPRVTDGGDNKYAPSGVATTAEWINFDDLKEDDEGDGRYAVADVSYQRYSHSLTCFKFMFDDSVLSGNIRILGLRVRIKKYASAPGVKDQALYLFKIFPNRSNHTPISYNLASSEEWPLSPEIKEYGDFEISSDGSNVWMDTPLQFNGLTHGLNVAFAVYGTVNGITRANVDLLNVKLFYEELAGSTSLFALGGDNFGYGRVIIYGEANVKSSAWGYTGSGGLEISGQSEIYAEYFYLPYPGDVLFISGNYGLGFSQEGSGEVVIGGTSKSKSSFYKFDGDGELIIGGTAIVFPHYIEPVGGVVLSGKSLPQLSISYIGSGEVKFEGTGYYISFVYKGGGELVISGTFPYTSSSWVYKPDSGVLIHGGSSYISSHLGDVKDISVDLTMDVFDMKGIFSEDIHLGDAEDLSDITIRECGCISLPLKLYCETNIFDENKLSEFLFRNGRSIVLPVEMSHNYNNNSWQYNFYAAGFASDAITQENWSLMIDLQCSDQLAYDNIYKKVWKLSAFVQRIGYNGERDSTRVLIAFLPETICSVGVPFKFTVKLDTNLNLVTINPESHVYYYNISDGIGLFQNKFWNTYSVLEFSVFELSASSTSDRIDLTDQVFV